MKIILPLAVAAMVLLEMFNLKTSQRAGLVYALVFVFIVLGTGAYEAWSRKRGVLGFIVNILASASAASR